MAKGINKVSLLGNVGQVEISFHNGNMAIANVSLATNERVKEGGEWKDAAEWHNLVFFGKLAELVREYVDKGSKLYVEGRLRTRSWEAKDGSGRRYKTEIIGSELVFLGGRQERGEYSQEAPAGEHEHSQEITDEDVPF